MTIQGIIKGFANPIDHTKNLVLVGRGPRYIIIHDGDSRPADQTDFTEVLAAFNLKAASVCGDDWRDVTELSSNNVNGISTVEAVGSGLYGQYVPYVE